MVTSQHKMLIDAEHLKEQIGPIAERIAQIAVSDLIPESEIKGIIQLARSQPRLSAIKDYIKRKATHNRTSFQFAEALLGAMNEIAQISEDYDWDMQSKIRLVYIPFFVYIQGYHIGYSSHL